LWLPDSFQDGRTAHDFRAIQFNLRPRTVVWIENRHGVRAGEDFAHFIQLIVQAIQLEWVQFHAGPISERPQFCKPAVPHDGVDMNIRWMGEEKGGGGENVCGCIYVCVCDCVVYKNGGGERGRKERDERKRGEKNERRDHR